MQRKGQTEPELVPSEDENVVNVEHVLPEHPDGHYPNVDPKDAAANHNRIGNMVILQARNNSIIGNSAFDVKKPILLASS
jgi:hypothetical protein